MNWLSSVLVRREIVFRSEDYMLVRAPFFSPDGVRVSVQASAGHYCSPRENNPANGWTTFEVMVLDGKDDPKTMTEQEVLELLRSYNIEFGPISL